jgi:hypothetical protein
MVFQSYPQRGERTKPFSKKGLWGDHPEGEKELSTTMTSLGIRPGERSGVIPLQTPEASTRAHHGQVPTREKILIAG